MVKEKIQEEYKKLCEAAGDLDSNIQKTKKHLAHLEDNKKIIVDRISVLDSITPTLLQIDEEVKAEVDAKVSAKVAQHLAAITKE